MAGFEILLYLYDWMWSPTYFYEPGSAGEYDDVRIQVRGVVDTDTNGLKFHRLFNIFHTDEPPAPRTR